MGFYWISMIFLLDFYDISLRHFETMRLKQVFYRILMELLWHPYRISMMFLLRFYGITMGVLAEFYGILQGFLCGSYAISMLSLYNLSIRFLWASHGLFWDFK